jgi:hypothetical protein
MVKFDVRPDIDAAAERLSFTLGARREIKHLPEVLWEGEQVERLATGQYGAGEGVLAMTDRRLLFLKHGITRQQLEDFPYSKISSVEWRAGIALGTLAVYASGNKAEISPMTKDDGKALADALRERLAAGAAPTPATEASAGGQDVESRLATLDRLRSTGAITDEEYQDRRAKILDSL